MTPSPLEVDYWGCLDSNQKQTKEIDKSITREESQQIQIQFQGTEQEEMGG